MYARSRAQELRRRRHHSVERDLWGLRFGGLTAMPQWVVCMIRCVERKGFMRQAGPFAAHWRDVRISGRNDMILTDHTR